MRISTVILLVIALASAGVSAAFWSELRAERALNAELSARLEAANAARPSPPPPTAPTDEPTPVAPADSPAPPQPATPVPAEAPVDRPNVVQGRENDWRANQRRLMSDPKYRDAWREQQRLQMAQRREDYIEILGFTPQQADAAIELAIDRQMWAFETSSPLSSNPDDAQRQTRERNEAEERAYQAKLRDLLGAEKSAHLQTYMESRQSRMQVDRLRNQLTGGDALRDDQVEPLIAAMHAEQSQLRKDMQEFRDTLNFDGDPRGTQTRISERQAELMKVAHARMHASASGILSASQLEKLDTMLKRDLERLEAQQRMQRIRSKLEQPAPTGTRN